MKQRGGWLFSLDHDPAWRSRCLTQILSIFYKVFTHCKRYILLSNSLLLLSQLSLLMDICLRFPPFCSKQCVDLELQVSCLVTGPCRPGQTVFYDPPSAPNCERVSSGPVYSSLQHPLSSYVRRNYRQALFFRIMTTQSSWQRSRQPNLLNVGGRRRWM